MHKYFPLFLLFCLCANPVIPVNKLSKLTPAEKAVYLCATHLDTNTHEMIILDSPVFESFDTTWVDSVVHMDCAIAYNNGIKNFSWKNYDFDLGINHLIIDTGTLRAVFHSGAKGWVAFDSTYPQAFGYYQFSKIGFNADSTVGILYFIHQYADLGGDSYLLSVRKVNDNWQQYRVYLWKES